MIRTGYFLLLLLQPACATYEPLGLPQGFIGLDAAVEEQPVQRGYLGIQVQPNESESLEDLETLPGLRIVGVEPGSPAQRAGLLPGDVLLAFAGVPVNDPDRLESLLLGITRDTTVTLRLQRGARVLESEAGLGVRAPGGRGRTLYHVERVLVRAAFRNGRKDGAYPVVAWLAADSPLRAAGVRIEETVVSFQDHDPGSAGELVRHIGLELRPGDEVRLGIRDAGGQVRTVVFPAWDPGRALTGLALWPLFSWSENLKEDREDLLIGDLVLFSFYRCSRVGSETEYSILSLFSWKTGEAVLESARDLPPGSVGGQ